MSNNPERTSRRNIEAKCLLAFDQVLEELGIVASGRGYGASNRFDPNFGLIGRQRFQFGDLRVDLSDRIVVVEVESGGGTNNLVKYWPLASTLDRPLLLLHGFGQGSANDYVSHLNLWDFLWRRMSDELWSVPTPRLFARRFQYAHGNIEQLGVAAEMFRECLTLPFACVLPSIFNFDLISPGVARSTKSS